MQQPGKSERESEPRRPYNAPAMVDYGRVLTLTQGDS